MDVLFASFECNQLFQHAIISVSQGGDYGFDVNTNGDAVNYLLQQVLVCLIFGSFNILS